MSRVHICCTPCSLGCHVMADGVACTTARPCNRSLTCPASVHCSLVAGGMHRAGAPATGNCSVSARSAALPGGSLGIKPACVNCCSELCTGAASQHRASFCSAPGLPSPACSMAGADDALPNGVGTNDANAAAGNAKLSAAQKKKLQKKRRKEEKRAERQVLGGDCAVITRRVGG